MRLAGWAASSLLAAQLAMVANYPALADDSASALSGGKAVFELKCAACHMGGGNAISPSKTLQLPTLEANGYASQEALVQLISVGKGQMPSYGPKAPP